MVENARRSKVEGQRRGTPIPQWEVFVREDKIDPLGHVGSVSATDADMAAEHASELFGWCAADLWVCPAEAVERYSTRSLVGSDEETETEAEIESESRSDLTSELESRSKSNCASDPRVDDEPGGTPQKNDSEAIPGKNDSEMTPQNNGLEGTEVDDS